MQALFKHSNFRRLSRVAMGLLLGLAHGTAVAGLTFNVPLVSLTNHNTSAYSAYNQANFGANFSNATYISQTQTMPIDPSQMDASMNWITPAHVSKTDVHTLIPSRPDLRWFAHATPWFTGTAGSHINIGLNCNTAAYVQAMVTDMKNRGFNGVVIDWYGQGSTSDGATQKLKTYLQSIPGNTFTYIVMVDKGVSGGLSTNNLDTQIQYCQNNYFSDTNYEREPVSTGKPILMFFGVRSVVGASGMADVKAQCGGNMVWVEQGTSYLGEAWEDQCFEWTDCYGNGVNWNDPYNLGAVTGNYGTIKNSGKKAFGAMCSRFDGTLTKSIGWSLGKYLPCSNSLCMVQRAAAINSAIFPNMTRMQWCTWSDWEEGTQVESPMENYFAVSPQFVSPNTLSWGITNGDERTVDHYELYASQDGVNAAFMGNVPTGHYSTNLTQIGLAPGSYYLFVDAVGKPCVRDHLSAAVSAVLQTGASITQQPTNQTVFYGGTASFYVAATGTPPITYTWWDQNYNTVGTNSTLVISNAMQNNSYSVLVQNPYGSIQSFPASLTVVTGPGVVTDLQPLTQTVYQGDPVSFTVGAAGMPPLGYQWKLNGQAIAGATGSSYAFAALQGTNLYQVTVSNSQGSTNSSTATVVGLPATYLNPANYYGRRITFSGYTNGVTLQNFPVLIRLSTSIPGFSYSQFVSPSTGADLRFTTANNRLLPFEIEQWNPTGESLVWVQVPSITSSNDSIMAYWGNTFDSAPEPSNTNGVVWANVNGTNNCVVVYHLSQSGSPFADSTLQYPGTSGTPPTSTTGEVGRGAAFNGSQFLNSGVINLGKTFTASVWVNIATSASNEQTLWANKQGGWNVAGFDFYVNTYNTADGKVYFDTADGVGGNVGPRTAGSAVSFGHWHQLTGTLDGVNGAVHVYVDGVDQTIDTGVDTSFPTTNYVRLGALLTGTPGTTGNYCLNGTMDEARLESGIRSPAWVWASWATVATSTFATFGPVGSPLVMLQAALTNGQLVLTWSTGTLQSAPTVNGPWSTVNGASSPYAVPPTGAQLFFRVRAP